MARTTATILPFPTAESGNTSNFKETKRGQGDGDGGNSGGGGKRPGTGGSGGGGKRGGGEDKPKKATALQIRKLLEANSMLTGMFRYDTFANRTMLEKPIPRPDRDPPNTKFEPRPLADHDITFMAEVLEVEHFENQPMELIARVAEGEGMDHAYSPPAEAISGWVWDKTPRIGAFFMDYCGVVPEGETLRAQADHENYIRTISRCFFISIVARVFSPGEKVDTMVVLEGEQGEKKSKLLRKLAIREGWFSDNLPHDLATKDAREHLPGNLIIEMAELSQFRKSEVETVKSFLSAQHDKYRPSYGRYTIDWPRQNVFIGTTNHEHYLKDTTGNRRFWPLKVGRVRADDVTEEVVQQCYAEAKAAFDAKEQWWLTDAMEELAREQQKARTIRDPWCDTAVELVRDRRKVMQPDDTEVLVTPVELLLRLGLDDIKHTKGLQMRAGDVLKDIGGERVRKSVNGTQARRYSFTKGLTNEDPPDIPPEEEREG